MTDQAENTSLELQRPAGVAETAALGQLATVERLPEVRGDSQWEQPETGLQTELATVHLGRKVDAAGWNAGFVDNFEAPVPDAGISFGVSQASHGPTSIFAKALKGYRVEAAQFNESGMVSWLEPDTEGQVKVTLDGGNMAKTNLDDMLAGVNLGNPGTRAGIVRVTGPDKDVKYFALGADFQGEPDDWTVAGGIIEVQPKVTEQLAGSQVKLPPPSAK